MKTATLWGLFAFAALGLFVNQSFAQGQGTCFLPGDCPEGSMYVKFDTIDEDNDGDGYQDLVQVTGDPVDCEFIVLDGKAEEDGPDEITALLAVCDGYTIEFMLVGKAGTECEEGFVEDDGTGSWEAGFASQGLSNLQFCLRPCPPEATTVEIGDPYLPDGQTLKKIDVDFTNTNGFVKFNFYLLEGAMVADASGDCVVDGSMVTCERLPQAVTVTFMQMEGAGAARFMGVAKTLCGDTDIDPALTFETPEAFKLLGNYPNPFNPSTTIRYEVPDASFATLQVFDTLGRLVNTLHSGGVEAGTHSVEWDGTNSQGQAVSSGVYLYRLDAGSFTSTKSMLLFK